MLFSPDGIKIPTTQEYNLEEIKGVFHIYLPKGHLIYIPHFLSGTESQDCINHFLEADDLRFPNILKCPHSTEELEQALWKNIPWRRDKIKIFGKEHLTPRFTSWHGDANANYSYSNTPLIPSPWTKELTKLKKKVEASSGVPFNSVLLNWYRDGNDHMGWHSDNEKELGKNPIISSLNFGASRKFVLRRISNHKEKVEIILNNGDLLIMTNETQHFWHHYVPKQKKTLTNRFNLTFRQIKT